MKFEIDFNRENDEQFILSLGAELEYGIDMVRMVIELDTFEELEELIKEVDEYKDDLYSTVVSFDPPTIFFDNDV